MKASRYRFSFNENASNLASLSPDGKLKIWETCNGNLSQEWAPQPSLETSCTCLCWVSVAESRPSRPKKAKRKSTTAIEETKSHIVLGTGQGSLLLLNYDTLEVENKLVNEHKEKVNDICYNEKRSTVYSGSNDKYVIEWSYPSITVKRKWKADKLFVQKLQVSPDGSCLLSAGRTIKLWNLETKELLQKFTGHVNPITSLLFAPLPKSKSFSEECYFLSVAQEDQLVNAWHHDPSSKDTNAVCCFMNVSDPVTADILLNDEQQLKLGVACQDGHISIFTHLLNGRLTKPINSSLSSQFVTSGSENNSSSTMRIFALKLMQDDTLLVVYGSPINPTFEKIKLSTMVNGSKLKRETSKGLMSEINETGNSKIKPQKIVDKSVVIDSHAALQLSSADNRELATSDGGKTVDKNREELSLGERLNADVAPQAVTKQNTPRLSKSRRKRERQQVNASSVTQMLTQGLHSGDDKLIDNVLYSSNKEAVIMPTIKRLPKASVLTLINKVVQRIQRNPARGYVLTIWIKVIMTVHMTYLMSIPNLMSSLSGLYQSLESRTKVYPKLSKLHGRLDLLITHVSQRKQATVDIADVNEPLLSIEDQEESEDENFDEDDGMFQEDEESSPALDQDDNCDDDDNDDENSDGSDDSDEESDNEHLAAEKDKISDNDSDEY
eukprot:Seg44.1 transcript_id=Seg44.1/GoldUCD/mRNA.D3Y31 product="WD repeat-containing protein 43" protein_id=Seg44.1/GoldUCD/D3Y31